jgi:CheY-like chemotaxis protein
MKTILVAEDEAANFKYLEIILEQYGYHVLWAQDGAEAVEICRNNTISLIMMDIRMPGMDGLQATEIIRSFNLTVPIIVQTAYASVNDEKVAKEAGCSSFITKPIYRKTIQGILEKYLG